MQTDVDTPDTGEPQDAAERPVVKLKKVRRSAAAEGPSADASDAGDGDGDGTTTAVADPEDDPRYLPAHLDPTAPTILPPLGPIEHSRGWRRWFLRIFVVSLLIAAAATIAVAATMIVEEADKPEGRKPVNGVLMPDDSRFRDIANQLLSRKRPEKVTGIVVTGEAGEVTVVRYKRGQTSFMSNYLNPNALQVIARAIGVRSDDPITVDELRLEVLRRTGRQRWRLRGEQSGQPWRATINPNGTNLRIIPVNDGN
ncbi:hypothetical protein DSM112329_00526 [Paraconexibacter sp. AEG42_29]|uniref:Uncharacterized protein n=1 Tax=Paraconexibacter sp. AEG42_29 TaxID=2997339 RepID=A0AAU7AQ06_9ACTN